MDNIFLAVGTAIPMTLVGYLIAAMRMKAHIAAGKVPMKTLVIISLFSLVGVSAATYATQLWYLGMRTNADVMLVLHALYIGVGYMICWYFLSTYRE